MNTLIQTLKGKSLVDHHFVNDFGEVQSEQIVDFEEYTKLIIQEVLNIADNLTTLNSIDSLKFSDSIKQHFEI